MYVFAFFINLWIEFQFYAFCWSLSLQRAVVYGVSKGVKHDHEFLWLITDLHNSIMELHNSLWISIDNLGISIIELWSSIIRFIDIHIRFTELHIIRFMEIHSSQLDLWSYLFDLWSSIMCFMEHHTICGWCSSMIHYGAPWLKCRWSSILHEGCEDKLRRIDF